ncbi:hypothetical protein A3I45_00010 [Candidatus Uhrbacteria bacterium RIFCSPLOWO2_02_FULL_53_10]|uniref:Thioredoxin-like fold domain-containing protein n=1 Tax=Candidatus Uhrbacteria bacterium RIFCSPLOWO2_02_FULL_53_10 TaxID=1802411 RepID=A0A1F7VHA6_9BACT|nr:MAG: hypothetical protein A3I45_00010 [Candidatus Uhrbacteria bacterium RIFCSPLOWO2_02_FULL_53_10]
MQLTPHEEASTVLNAKQKHTGVWIVVGIVVVLALLFLWRVIVYAVQISRGMAIPPQSFSASITLDQTLEKSVLNTPSETETILAIGTGASDDPSLGPPEALALLTITEFADFGCPFSRETSYIARALAEHTDIVRYVYRDFPLTDLHPNADVAAQAGQCANEQGRFVDYHDKLYQNQYDLSTERLKQYAQEIGLETRSFNACLDSHRYAAEVAADKQAGMEAGVRGTPTFFFNGARVEGAFPRAFLTDMLRQFRGVANAQTAQ